LPSSLLDSRAAPCRTEAAVELSGVSYHYAQGVDALRDVSLRVLSGEKVAVLGANGCGKSTLLRVMNGLTRPTSGVVRAFGEEVSERALRDMAFAHRLRRRVGFIFQNSDAQLFSSTVRDEIAFGPLQMELPQEEVRQRVADTAAMLGIERLLDRAPYHLSGGEKKKVALASVLVVNPSVLLLDEPTNGLDPRSQRWLVDLIVALHRAGKTVITATHDLGIVHEIADRVVVMAEDHTVAAEGPAGEILADLDLLLRVNLVHEHAHRHGNLIHSHPHHHGGDHDHAHDQPEL
jgi:cobalt/nickel transport system ATP-binding protein